jgi:hypothetical protein
MQLATEKRTRHDQAMEVALHSSRDRESIVLKTKPVWWFDQKKPEPTASPIF